MGEQQLDVDVKCECPCMRACVYVYGNAKVSACSGDCVFHTELLLPLRDEGEGDVTQRKSQSHVSCLDLCQGF